uniref:lymphocyte antigen 86 isoform X1 n=1 Tax=Myodes glareolus TaxID=447135 RepID=UPI002021026E|nr:lymphocyte antigen 86 isoform X1 [Myodes glareolus]
MNSVAAAALLVWTLTSPSSSGHGRGDAWPTHTACSSGGLEVLYQSCDPLQDFGLSIDQCSRHVQPSLNIRFGIILREDISKLFLDMALVSGGSSVLNFSYPICEEDLPKFSFCGRRKGAKIQRLLVEAAEVTPTPRLRTLYLKSGEIDICILFLSLIGMLRVLPI